MNKGIIVGGMMALAMFSSTINAVDLDAGKAKSMVCAAYHGRNGVPGLH